MQTARAETTGTTGGATRPASLSPGAFHWTGAGWILLILNLFVAVGSTSHFLFQLHIGFVPWAMMNSCALAVFLFAGGFLGRSLSVMAASSVFMLFYGVSGLITFGWGIFVLGAQIGHLLMLLTGAYILTTIVRLRAWRPLLLGAALGVALLVPYALIARTWGANHPELMDRFLSGELMRPVA